MGVFNSRQLRETAIGLEKSGVRFLWVVRPPLPDSQTQEQRMNRIFMVEEMKVALAFREAEDDQFVNAAELEERVIELMNSKKGEAVRERVLKLREDAVEAKSDGGSSCIAMAKLVDSFKKG
ncbi:hypothetical protein D5086_027903 [Populus alba]|uniref:Uncharacterized protein n=1 Tax=Populus alba TaxID=43335 RepID=A0ACC4AWL8_POPAL